MERLAATDMRSAISYEQAVRDFHEKLREWHYQKLFSSKPYQYDEAVESIPAFEPTADTGVH